MTVLLGLSVEQALRDLGYLGLALLMVGETVFPPIPSEAVLPLAGYMASQGDFSLPAVLIASTAGSVIGAQVLYEAARRGGRGFAERFLLFARLNPEKLAQAESWFARRGPVVVLAGRCVPGVRSLISLPAGVLRMPRWEYLLFTLLGSAVWNTVLVGAGYLLGSRWDRVSEIVGPLSLPLLGIALLVAAFWMSRVLRTRRDSSQ